MRYIIILLVTVFSKNTLDAQVSASGNSLWTNPKDGMTFVWIPAGSFEIEIPYDSSGTIKYTKEKKTFTEGFWMGQTEVTVRQYQNFVKETGYITEAEINGDPFNWKNTGFRQKKDHPVVYISYQDIEAYTEWGGVDIPYENEWLYACKAGISNRFYWGDEFDDKYVWYRGNSMTGTKPVGKKLPNRWELYDMVGNVWEFIHICDGIVGLRGGAWTRCDEASGRTGSTYSNIIYGTVSPRMMRCVKTIFQPSNRDDDRGFRCIKRGSGELSRGN